MNTNTLRIEKCALKGLIEPFIYERLNEEIYEVNSKAASDLLTWNRFDLAFKLVYLDNICVYPRIANEVYKDDIKAQTLGKFIELGNEVNKQSFEDYCEQFKSTYEDIKKNGFLKEKTLIPLSTDGGIINGAHRVASALHLNKDVATVATAEGTMVADYQYFFDRDVSVERLDVVAQKFIQYSSSNVHIAFLWPSGDGFKDEAENLFTNVVYKKKINLGPRGAFNLLVELYKHMDWVGTKEDGYKGIKQKLVECFPKFEPFQVIIFQSDSLTKVQAVKEQVRDIYRIGYSSVHITDTKDEAIRISQLLLNVNALHFLNYAAPYKFLKLFEKLNGFKQFLVKNSIDSKDVLLDGSLVLTLYGLRKNIDIDFLIADNSTIKFPNDEYETHDSVLKYHDRDKSTLIYDNNYHFTFFGLKFISFAQLYQMKEQRNEEKDRNDCFIMKSLLEGKAYKKVFAQLKQKIFYMKIKLHSQTMATIMKILSVTGVYKPVRFLYRKIKGEK